ncbi:MAG: Brp/Blh family beta-carotene 15,15'-dioxygenase [Henriciella sp.]|nr:Brp/Blh family beta-carotene 15,15'-dioxygenase [Henriciella sp.]
MSWTSIRSNFLLAGLTVSLIFFILPPLSVTVQVIALGIAVAFLGLPHGAIDAYITHQEGLWRSAGGLAVFAGIYALIALTVIGTWILMPILSLSAFLVISAWHFGADANARSQVERWLFGGLLLSLPSFFHPANVASLFEAISGPSAVGLVPVLQVLAPVAAIGVIAMLVRPQSGTPRRWTDIATVSGLILFAWALPPLVYFAVYFCALHSPAHFQRVIRLVPTSQRSGAIAQTAGFTALTLVLAGVAFIVMADAVSLQQSTLQIVFIGLAALTVPHMFLVDGICRSKLGEAK